MMISALVCSGGWALDPCQMIWPFDLPKHSLGYPLAYFNRPQVPADILCCFLLFYAFQDSSFDSIWFRGESQVP